MRKRMLLILTAVLLAVVPVFSSSSAEEIVTLITCAEDLLLLSRDPAGSYALENDIDLAGTDWKPVRFSGTLDGNGYAIRNLSVSSFDSETAKTMDGNGYKYNTRLMAFFSVLDHATVRNIRFENAEIRAESEDHAFIAILAAVSTHSVIEKVSVSGSACLYCGAKMGGVGGIVGFGTGSITDSDADVTLVYADTNKKKKCEQFLGGAVANGFMDCYNVSVQIDGYASVYGYAHCGGVIGMHRQHEKRTKAHSITHISGCSAAGRITFFEKNSNRRAYCKGIIGENLSKYAKLQDNDDSGFERNEIKKYDQVLLPENWPQAE